MNAVEQGRAIISISKALKALSADDPQVARHLYATRIAGNAGLLASSIRGHSTEGSALRPRRLQVLYNDVGLDILTFGHYVKPWLIRNNLAYFSDDTEGQEVLIATILTYDAILRAVTDLFESLESESEKAIACHHLVHLASELPLTVSTARQRLSGIYSEESAEMAIALCRGLRLVSFSRASATNEAIIYSDRIWKSVGERAANALPNFSTENSAALRVLVESVREHQGYPEPVLRRWAKSNNAEKMLNFAIGIGLISQTGIRTNHGMKHFLTTPHFYAEVEEEFGEDVCDRVKLFLNSIRHGQYFSVWGRGQIQDPGAILRALLNNNKVGPATAIGEDYTMAERAGIIKIERSHVPDRYNMILVQDDVARKTLEVVERRAITPMSRTLQLDEFRDDGQFVSIPETRARLAELPGPMQEAEEDYLNTLRES
jgi:hypothetical protein